MKQLPVAGSQLPVRIKFTGNWLLATDSSYLGVGTLTFRVHTIYLGA